MGAALAPATMGMSIPIGMAVGALGGALGGMGQDAAAKAQQAAIEAQQRAIAQEMKQRAKGVGATRAQFGDINAWGQKFNGGSGFAAAKDPSKYQDLGTTLQNRSAIAGGIQGNVEATTAAGKVDLTGAAQQGAASIRQASASRGLLGSSLDTSAKQHLLGQYAGGKANLAGAADATRQAGWGAIQGQQAAFENAAQRGANISGQLGALSNAGAIAGARGQQPAVFGANLINTGMGIANYGALAQANGGQGVQALGLPKMNLPGNKVAGASTSKGV